MPTVHVVLPGDIDDPATPSGGNGYDRRVCAGLAAAGWSVREHPVPGDWPTPSPAEHARLAELLTALPDDALVLVDGLVASVVPDALAAQARRLRLVPLVHLPRDDDTEARALASATVIVATSTWTRDRLLHRYALAPSLVHVAAPGWTRRRRSPDHRAVRRCSASPRSPPTRATTCWSRRWRR